jgi:hypothetical protein
VLAKSRLASENEVRGDRNAVSHVDRCVPHNEHTEDNPMSKTKTNDKKQLKDLYIEDLGQVTGGKGKPPVTTMAIGEEDEYTTMALGEEDEATTLAIGEEDDGETM